MRCAVCFRLVMRSRARSDNKIERGLNNFLTKCDKRYKIKAIFLLLYFSLYIFPNVLLSF